MSRRRRDSDAYYWERRGTPTTADEANLDAALDIQARFYEKPGQAHHEERGAPTADVPDLAAMEEWPPLGGPAPVVAVANGDSEPAAPVVDVGVQPEASSVAVNDTETAPEAIANLDAALDIQACFYEKPGQAHREERGAPTADVIDLAAITWPKLGESASVAGAVNGDSERAAPVVDAGVQPEASAVAVNDSETAPEAIALDIQARNYEKSGGQAHREEQGAPTADVTDLAAISGPKLGESAPVAAVVNGDSERAAPVVDAGVQPEASAVAVNDSETAPETIENQPEIELLPPAEVARVPIPEHLRGELSNVDIDTLATADADYEIFGILYQQRRTSLLGVELE